MLNSAVPNVEELCVVQNTANQLRVITGKIQSYEYYCSLLVATAITYDDKHKPKSFLSGKPNNNSRKIYRHDFSNFYDDSWGDYDGVEPFNVNTSIQDIEEYSTNFQRARNNNNQSTLLPSSIYGDMNNQSNST